MRAITKRTKVRTRWAKTIRRYPNKERNRIVKAIELRLGTSVIAVDAERKCLSLENANPSAGSAVIRIKSVQNATDRASRRFSLMYLKRGRIVALDCVNPVKDHVQGKKLVEQQIAVQPVRLADRSVARTELVDELP